MLTFSLKQRINWELGNDLKEATLMDGKKLTKDLLLEKLPVKKDDKILLFETGKRSICDSLFKKLNGNTYKEVLTTLNDGLVQHLDPKDDNIREFVYNRISSYFDSELRLELITNFESNNLSLVDILGDSTYWGNELKSDKNGIWYYNTEG